jgi:sortase family protein
MSRLVMSGRRGAVTVLALAALVAGVVLVVVAVRAQQSAPQPPRAVGRIDTPSSQRSPSGAPSSSPSASASPTPSVEPADKAHEPLGASKPVRIRIPAAGVDSKVNPLGLADDGTLAVPQPGPHLNQAAWFDESPTPGQPGPSIIEGHVDSESGPSVFLKLGNVRPGNKIYVTRKDGIEVVFTVNAVRDYKKSSFPTRVVYGGDLDVPQLRLITCSDFDASIHHHVGNEVVFSHLTAVRRHPHHH